MSQDSHARFEALFRNEMSEHDAREFLIALYEKGESGEDIAAAASVMRQHSIKLDMDEKLRGKLIDIVGTGGDKSGSFNISSTVSLILASLGCYVAKHGNRAITSNSGSADMLESLGINLNLTPENQVKMLEEVGFTFMFAINHHPAMKHIMPIRKSIPHRTIFNILGPLTNPAGATKYLLGVFDQAYVGVVADALLALGSKNAMVVSSNDGMDEISVSDTTYYTQIQNGALEHGELDPREYGLQLSAFEAVKGGNAIENADITRALLDANEKGAKRDIVLLNGACALVVDQKAGDIKEGIAMMQEAIDSGSAKTHLAKIIEISNRL
jgi:anthranilate phosphoribosyltransferase